MKSYGFCVACDDVVETNDEGGCVWCQTPTEPIPEQNPRERGDDDGVEYADPGDRLRGYE